MTASCVQTLELVDGVSFHRITVQGITITVVVPDLQFELTSALQTSGNDFLTFTALFNVML